MEDNMKFTKEQKEWLRDKINNKLTIAMMIIFREVEGSLDVDEDEVESSIVETYWNRDEIIKAKVALDSIPELLKNLEEQ